MRSDARLVSFIALAGLAPAFFLSSGNLCAQEVANIVGQIRLQGGSLPPDRVLVTLETRGLTINNTYCDNEGRFFFYNLLGNLYYISVEAEGFQPVRQAVVVNPTISQNSYVRIVLRPSENPAPNSPPELASGANPYLVNSAEYAKDFPRAAVKEFEAGVKADEKGKTEEAIRHYQKAVSIAPGFYPARNNLGAKYLAKGEFEAAEKEFAEAIKLNPNDAQAYFNLGNVFLVTKRYDQAAGTLQQGLNKRPDSALGRLLLGSVQIHLGALSEAERSLRTGLALDPQLSRAQLELTNLYLLQHRRADAIRELKSFVEMFPHDPMLPKAKEVLKKLEESQPAANSKP